MRVLLDDTPFDLEARYVGEAIAAAATLAEDQGRLIVDVVVDGQTWTEPQLARLDDDRTPAAEVRLTTAEPASLVCQALNDAAVELNAADHLQREAAELVETNQTVEAMQRLSEALGIWDSVRQAISMSAQLMSLDLQDVDVEGTPLTQLVTMLNDRLRLIKTSLEAQDPIGLADTLLYELPEVIQELRDLLEELQQRVGGARSQ